MQSRRLLWLLAYASLIAAGCSEGADTPGAAASAREIVVRPTAVALRAGETAQLAAQVNDSSARPVPLAPIEYGTTSANLIHVNSLGLITTAGPVGRDSVTVTSGSVTRFVPVTVSAGVAKQVELVGGNGQVGTVGSGLADAVVVRVRDAFGNPVPRVPVRFSVAADGKVEPNPAVTDAGGIGRAAWTLGTVAGRQALEARADSVMTVVEATAQAGRMERLEQLGAFARRVSAGDTVRVRLRVTDEHGNGVAGAEISFSVVAGGGAVAASRMESPDDGVIEAHWVTGPSAGVNSLRVVASEVRDITHQIELRTHAGNPARATLVSGANQRAAAGAAVGTPPSVRVVDANGNAIAGVRVRFSASAGGTVEPREALTDARGVATTRRWTLGSAGENVLSVVPDGLTDTLRVVARAR